MTEPKLLSGNETVAWLRSMSDRGGKGVVNNVDARSLGRCAYLIAAQSAQIEALTTERDELRAEANDLDAKLRESDDIVDAQSAEIAKLREALRLLALHRDEGLTCCGVCGCDWETGKPERHVSGCLAAPDGKKE